MEIVSKDGTNFPLNQTDSTEFGRGLGFNTTDRTVSRRHISFKLNQTDPEIKPRVEFQVIGKNPIWVRSSKSGEIWVFKRDEKGEMEEGDMFCVSGKVPVWFCLKRKGFFDASDIDPVKEFGFLVMGNEFVNYPKKMIRDIKNWDWFLEEHRKDSDEEDISEEKGGRVVRKKRKSVRANDDDDNDWRDESEEDEELISKVRKVKRSDYLTRSKDRSKPLKNSKSNKSSVRKKSTGTNEEEDEDEETLGGFIVDNEDVEQEEEEIDEDEEEEEEFDENDNDE